MWASYELLGLSYASFKNPLNPLLTDKLLTDIFRFKEVRPNVVIVLKYNKCIKR